MVLIDGVFVAQDLQQHIDIAIVDAITAAQCQFSNVGSQRRFACVASADNRDVF